MARSGSSPFGRRRARFSTKGVLFSLLTTAPRATMAACLSLRGSKACSAFQSASVSTTEKHIVDPLYVVL